jgi:hypothetical protein
MTKQKLSVEDFYHQFHGAQHHNDPGDHVKPHATEINPSGVNKHKPFNLAAYRKGKAKVTIHKNTDTMRLELSRKQKAK